MNWISFKTDKPKYSQPVLLYQDHGDHYNFFFAYWSKSEEKYSRINGITHWCLVTQPSTHTPEEQAVWDIEIGN